MTNMDKLYASVAANGPVCVGLDTEFSYLPADVVDDTKTASENVVEFNRRIIEATKASAGCYKVQIAYYESLGLDGMRAYAETLKMVRATGLPVIADITLLPDAPGQVTIDGGPGVGRVTKPGLDQPVGQAAINHVPRRMITDALHAEAEAAGYDGGFDVMISIEGGEEAAKRTFNPHIGVEGGLSVLGTSGIVEPMSQQAILDTVQLEIHQAALREQSPKRLILAPGNYGLDYLAQNLPEYSSIPVVKCSNFMGDALDMAAAEQFAEVLLVGHIGKLVKLAGGIMNTHSRMADCRTELFCTHAALCGASQATCRALMDAATTDACLDILDAENLREPVLESLLQAIQLHLDRRVAGAFRVGAVLFSNQAGPLGQTETAAQLLQSWQKKEQ